MSAQGRSQARITPEREARRVVQFRAQGRCQARITPEREPRRVVQ